MMESKTNDTSDREIRISRLLNAPIELVWEVWTDADHIKNWWGPEGFSNTIHTMDARKGGEWNLTMHGPDGMDYKNKSLFIEVIPYKKIVYDHLSNPKFRSTISFESHEKQTFIDWHMLFESKELFEQVVKTFKADQGLVENVDKLTRYLKAQGNLRKQLKTKKMSRVCTYLNFPGNTEEAFSFYKVIFGSEFNGGIQRFGDIPSQDGVPGFSEEDKKLILHVELPILGGHILMATDAPESMGFNVIIGNNQHIYLEPESREETKKLFDALAEGGTISMELQDMFWGAYYGSCKDKFGINWMVNFTDK